MPERRRPAPPAPPAVTVSDGQRKVAVDTRRVAALLARLAPAAGLAPGAVVDCAFVSPARMRALNREWRGVDRPTDVLSFAFAGPDEGAGGALALCPAYILRNVPARALSAEVALLLAHGLLHLAGYDHPEDAFPGSPMERAQRRLLAAAPKTALARLARLRPAPVPAARAAAAPRRRR